MEPDEVLRQFIELCNSRSGFLQHHLAQNAVLEWFGRTVRRGKKVYQYYRYDLCQQYEHYFQNAQRCDPIETKAPHMQTKQLPITDKNEKNDDDEPLRSAIEFTPIHSKSTPNLPALTQGREFLSINDDDDLSELGLANIQDATTPPQNNTQSSQPGEPLRKKVKYFEGTICGASDGDSPIAECSKSDTTVDREQTHGACKKSVNNEQSSCEKNIDSDPTQSHFDNNYSELMYIESIGTLRMRNKTKHRGVSIGGNDSCVESANAYWDRETKLKISYRIKKDCQQIQFALIIYEHITRNPTTRRNLLKEFQKADDDETKSSKKSNPPEIKRKLPLQRALRLF